MNHDRLAAIRADILARIEAAEEALARIETAWRKAGTDLAERRGELVAHDRAVTAMTEASPSSDVGELQADGSAGGIRIGPASGGGTLTGRPS
jgi:hypothetical protein